MCLYLNGFVSGGPFLNEIIPVEVVWVRIELMIRLIVNQQSMYDDEWMRYPCHAEFGGWLGCEVLVHQ